MTLLTDLSGALVSIHPATARLLGHAVPGALLGKKVDVLCAEGAPTNLPPLGPFPRGRYPDPTRDVPKDRWKPHPLNVTALPVLLTSGMAVQWTLSDPRRRRSSEETMLNLLHQLEMNREQIKKADAVKDDFLATVSHELRTPLTSICGYLKLLAKGAAGSISTEQTELVSAAVRNADRLCCW